MRESPWAVYVAGSRHMTQAAHADLVRERLRPYLLAMDSVLIHGAGRGPGGLLWERGKGALGCDKIAHLLASQSPFGCRIIECPALWDYPLEPSGLSGEQGRAAGPIRNKLCTEILSAHFRAGYRLAMLAFSTGGAGTEGAIRLVRQMKEPVLFEKIDVTL